MRKRIPAVFLALLLLSALLPACGRERLAGDEKEGVGMNAYTEKRFLWKAFRYPEEALVSFPAEDGGAALSELLGRTVKSGYAGMKHQEGTSLVHSPYFSLSAQGTEVPVYAAPVYIAAENKWKNPKTIYKNLQKLNRVGKCNLSDEDIYKVIMKES